MNKIPGNRFGTFKLPDEVDFVASHGQGAMIYATDGREFIDLVIGSGPLILGHAHPRIVAAVQQQIAKGTTYYVMNDVAPQLAERIVKHVPSAETVKFVGAGSEATFYALRIARVATGRDLILKFEGAFHGFHDYALQSLTPKGASNYPVPEPDSGGIPQPVGETILIAPFNDLEKTTEIAREYADRIAAIIVEPVQRTLLPSPGFLQGLRKLADQVDALLIFDEVVTGFRVALGGAEEAFGAAPDLTTMGKVIGGGLPLASVNGRRELLDLTLPEHGQGYAYMSGTLNGNALSAAAGIAAVDVIVEEDLLPRLSAVGKAIAASFTESARQLGVPFQMIGPPSVCEPVFSEGPIKDYRSYLTVNRKAALEFGLELIRRGVFVRPASKFYVPAILTDEQVARIGEAGHSAMTAVLVLDSLDAARLPPLVDGSPSSPLGGGANISLVRARASCWVSDCLRCGGERPDVTPAPIAVASAGPAFQPWRVAATALQPNIGSALMASMLACDDQLLGHALDSEDPELGVFVSDLSVLFICGGSESCLCLVDVLPLVHNNTLFGGLALYAYRLASPYQELGARLR
jgi:glutamate-1-semialdehyde 2,1-aminomutase